MYKFNGKIEFEHDNNGKNKLVLMFEKECVPTLAHHDFSVDGSTIIISDIVDKNVNCIKICNSSDTIKYNIFTFMESFNIENYLKLIELMKYEYIHHQMSIKDWTKLIIDLLIQTVTTTKRNIDPFRIVKTTKNGAGFIINPCKIAILDTNEIEIENDNVVIEILLPFFEYNKFDNKSLISVLIGKINRQVSPCGVVDTDKFLLHHYLNLFQIYQLYSHEVRK